MRFKSFPDFLLIQLKKFDIGADWTPYKLDVDVEMPDEIDISALKAAGLQPGEVEMPEDKPAPKVRKFIQASFLPTSTEFLSKF